MKTTTSLGILVAALAGTLVAGGCSTESFCWNCGEQDGGAAAGGTGGGGAAGSGYGGGAGISNTGGMIIQQGGSGGEAGTCSQTNNGLEKCDGIDNDCNGKVDDTFDLSKDPANCGVCGLLDQSANCTLQIQNADHALCTATPGTVGKCDYDKCSTDYFDLDGNRANGCEYYCVKKADTDNTCDNIDQDCNGKFDDGVNKCTDNANCGKCGRNCARPHAVGKCVPTGTPATCDDTNTACQIDSCENGWIDANKIETDGCEYQCTPTNGGVEACDGLDNDCDGLIDGLDPDLATNAEMGKDCYLSQSGECGQPAHKGITRCVAATVKCVDDNTGSTECTQDSECTGTTPYCVDAPTPGKKVCGTKVIKAGDIAEVCNSKDDDCDGQVDDSTTDSGGSCGSNAGICSQGKKVCTGGQLVCSGQVDPQQEICNGADDDCDGVIDGVAATPEVKCTGDGDCSGQAIAKYCLTRLGPNDKVCSALADDMHNNGQPLPCDVPTPPPSGWTSACQAGTLSCVGGAKLCVGSIKAQANQDQCGKDMNCDGVKAPDFDVQTDPHNCGSCGYDCWAKEGGHVNWTCVAGACTVPSTNKCDVGFIDCDNNPNDCEKACTFYSNKELCNGVDDNCDCHIDEMQDGQHPNGIVAPLPTQVCGISAAATGKCLTTSVACQAGTWKCTFPAGICDGGNPPSCSSTQDICDGEDNNCNGNIDENFKQPVLNQGYIGQTCASDDGSATKHGLCRQTGTYQCDPNNKTKTACMADSTHYATKQDCNTLQGGCEEKCDGQDNDCDGVADETFGSKGTNATYFVKPAVQKVNNIWVAAYEASRPNATDTDPGSGNGWWRSSSLLANQPAPPAGVTLDKTPACSVTGKIPWFNISGLEAQHVCKEMGGRLCKNGEWQTSCKSSTNTCTWAFQTNCTTYSTTSNWTTCNLGPFDFNPNTGGVNEDGLLPTGSRTACRANWGTAGLYDITGNLRELTCGGTTDCTATQSSFVLMGGAFNTQEPAPPQTTGDGAKCTFTFYNVDSKFKLYDVGFRCCFDADPTL